MARTINQLSTFRVFDDQHARLALVVLVTLPSVYVWSLPFLAGEGLHFAERCTGFPRCAGTYAGMISVGDLVANPQATGAYAAVFFWPAFHLWSLKGVIPAVLGQHTGLALVMVFYFSFAAHMVIPVTLSHAGHALACISYGLSALVIFTLLLWRFRARRLASFKFLLAVAAGAFCFSTLVMGADCLQQVLGRQHLPVAPQLWPWLLYAAQASSLSCLSLLPWFWRVGDAVAEEDACTPEAGSLANLLSIDTFVVLGRSRLRYSLLVLAALPVAYVWTLPLLTMLGFARLCDEFPRCADSDIGASVSNFIATPQATGAMAAAFFWPMAHMWTHKADIDGTSNFALLIGFYATFGLFLALPVTVYAKPHAMVVFAFCLCGLAYFGKALRHWRETELRYSKMILLVSIVSFASVVTLVAVNSIVNGLTRIEIVKEYAPWLFYVCEAAGLSSMSLLPWFWHVQQH